MSKAERKAQYFTKLIGYFDEYTKVFIVESDNVGSNQMQQIRMQLRGEAEILMGKNTLMRKAIRGVLDTKPELARLMPAIKGNVGLVFTNGDLAAIRKTIQGNKVQAPAKAGAFAPVDVIVPATITTMGPEKTSFFQALSIQTKINRGTIEIVSDVALIKAGDKVGASEATLLNMLNISPFAYGLVISHVFEEGSLYDPSVLDIETEDLMKKFREGVMNVTCVSLAIGYPTVVSVPHLVVNGYKNVFAVALATDITFPMAEKAKAFLADPEAALAAMAAAAGPVASASAPAAKEETKAAAKEESSESEDDGGMFDMFD
eukprot:Sdes_comp24603_c0_seq1m22445